ncbi:MAG: DUF4011 domain-containing protein, partial [bacterium]|nr:DUF4011 domain-containing protein [bacterium]
MSNLDLQKEIGRFRERLLDLSLRNPLLNYRKSKRRTLQIVNELPNVIYERLVGDGKSFIFDFVPDPPTDESSDLKTQSQQAELFGTATDGDGLSASDGREVGSAATESNQVERDVQRFSIDLPTAPEHTKSLEKHLVDEKLQTNLVKDKLHAVLRYMQREATTAMQETGINYLFLAVGFLSWQETESSEKDRMAPLILIPVKIEKVSKGNGEARYTASWDEDDVQFNLSLQKKLERDFELKLPFFDFETTPEEYFASIQAAIAAKPAWAIRREALLGFFTFHKLSMYADIDPANWDLKSEDGSGAILS